MLDTCAVTQFSQTGGGAKMDPGGVTDFVAFYEILCNQT